MASISRQKNGRRTIQFVAPDGKRKSIRLGKTTQRTAEAVKIRVEHLVAARMSGHAFDSETARWVAGLDRTMADKLARVGLIPKIKRATLGPFIDDYVTLGRAKPATKEVWRQGQRGLIEFFSSDMIVRDVTAGDAENYRLHLLDIGLASMTVRKRLQFANTVFRSMTKHRLIDSNPFAGVTQQGSVDKSRWYFITHDEMDKLLEAAPNQDWRTIIVLCRFGGLRCPSEVLSLKWEDVLWAQSRIVITSPKTEHHAGKESRVMPLFSLLRPHLEEAFEAAVDGAEYVIANDTYRKAAQGPNGWKNCNLRTQMEKIIRRAGLVQWPRLFHNLRASRETELAQEFPIHVVTAWMGNTPRVALKHYLQITDADFEKAIQEPTETLALQNPVQQVTAASRTATQTKNTIPQKHRELPLLAVQCEAVQTGLADGEGFEPPVRSPVQQFSRLPP